MRTVRAVRSFPLPVRLLLVNQLGVNTGFYLLIPYLATHLGQDLGLSAVAVGLVLGVRNLSQQGLFILGGSAADRLGARGVIIAGCALRTVGFGLFALGDGMTVLLAASALSGLAGALFNPAVRTYLAHESAERKAEAFALFSVFATTGALLGPLLGTALLLVDFRAAALTAAGIFALLTVAQACVLPPRPVPAPSTGVLGDWREVLGDRRFLAFALALVGLYALESQLYLLLPDRARQVTGWDGAVSLLFLTSTVANLTLQLRITRSLQQRGTRGRWIALGLLVAGLAFLLPLLAGGLVPLLLTALLLHVGVMIAQPFVQELIPAFGRASLTGTYYGVFYLVSGLAAALGNASVGWAMDTADWAPWLLCCALGLTCALAVARQRARLPDPTVRQLIGEPL
ncbi:MULTISPECIES: MFS transporter [unclassified Kitasatospora]|uniref:MFS transporter n=1 Tax=unclassified Kitasatospora TaxID=2633591 RepID=UPI0007106842|nr:MULTISPECIES: MFS transporter [unclassified Kitasatospora]KQV04441.1 transporter [Kitasatospora sp. Root107]KRB61028.1 transporter [Kitasatospora sp. Root187]